MGLVLRVLSNDLICASFGQADYLVGLMHSVDFHSWRTRWHARSSDPEKVVAFTHRNYLLSWHVAFNKLPVDHRGVTRRESWSDTQILFESTHVGFFMIDDGEAISLKMLNPFFATSAVCITMHIDGEGLRRLSR
ncbi:Uncharacterised protein [Pseudomonas fluorescens]|uniref:Uncharacterized protein n=1 Tax=Pseudomonas fluorescens TaxID=294 RepID=A0A379ILY3_PSEFL|nr:hypothetical protein SAMN04490207_3644 [Pseudomonas gessardii]SUD35151.1 Uncharacterised protein [Pseudomonas fluorescens]